MTENFQDILELIDTSFLKEEEKKKLELLFKEIGSSESFWKVFNQFLIADLRKRSSVYEVVIDNFTQKYDLLEQRYKDKRQDLEQTLNKNLETVGPGDAIVREEVFNQYYKDLDFYQNQHEGEIKNLYGQTFSQAMREMI